MTAIRTAETWIFRSPETQRRLRLLALFVAMLMSGGLLIFPRPLLLPLLGALCFMLVNPLRLFRREFMIIWLVLLMVAAAALVGGQALQADEMAIRYANFFAGFLLLLVYSGLGASQLSEDMMPILRIMAVQAILTPIVAIVLPGYFTTWEINETEYQSIYLIFTYHEFLAPALIKRPDGLFFEPGVFQFYLNTLLFIALFMRQFRWRDVLLAIAAIMFTQSTSGAVIMVTILAVYGLRRVRHTAAHETLLVLILVPLIIAAPVIYAYSNVVEKFTGEQAGSSWAREYDLRTGLAVVQENPLTGIGFDYDRYREIANDVGYKETILSDENITERSNSNGIIMMLYSVGIPIGLIFLWGMMRQRFMRPRALYGAAMALTLLSESLVFTPFMLAVIFSGLLIGRDSSGYLLPVGRSKGLGVKGPLARQPV